MKEERKFSKKQAGLILTMARNKIVSCDEFRAALVDGRWAQLLESIKSPREGPRRKRGHLVWPTTLHPNDDVKESQVLELETLAHNIGTTKGQFQAAIQDGRISEFLNSLKEVKSY